MCRDTPFCTGNIIQTRFLITNLNCKATGRPLSSFQCRLSAGAGPELKGHAACYRRPRMAPPTHSALGCAVIRVGLFAGTRHGGELRLVWGIFRRGTERGRSEWPPTPLALAKTLAACREGVSRRETCARIGSNSAPLRLKIQPQINRHCQ